MTIETLFAFTGIMLGLSLAITVLNQIVSNVLGLRGTALKWGLATMLQHLHPDEMRAERTSAPEGPHADSIADFVLRHELITDSCTGKTSRSWLSWLTNRWRLATAIRFEDFQRVLQISSDASSDLTEPATEWDPKKARTWLSRNLVVTREWFDSTMDRVAQRFAMKMRMCTIIFSFVMTFSLHLDTFEIFRALSNNPESVARFNLQLEALQQRLQSIDTSANSQAIESNIATVRQIRDGLQQSGVGVIPANLGQHFPYTWFPKIDSAGIAMLHLCGMLLTGALLSLGAPFWFNQLKNISTLRTVVAQKAASTAPRPELPPAATIAWENRR